MNIRRRYYVVGVPALLLVAFVVYRLVSAKGSDDSRRSSIPVVQIEKPSHSDLTIALTFTSDVLPVQQAAIYSKVSGNLQQIYTDMGNLVRRNQLLALIDTTELYQQYQQARATAENTRLTYGRAKELFDQNLVSKQDRDNAEAAAKVTEAAYDAAVTRLSYARITAPFSGFITRRYLDPGALVNTNSSILFTLMDLDQMKIIVNVLEQDIPRISIGGKATVTVDSFPGKTFSGIVTRFSQAVDIATRTMPIEIDLPNKEHLLRPGMFANVSLIVGTHQDALTLPTQALLADDQGPYLFTVRADTAHRVRIQKGIEQNSRTEILTGLDGSDDVITTGQQFARDGGPVIVQK